MVKKYLITGLSFSGKTYLKAFFEKKGFNAVDADKLYEISQWVNEKGERVPYPDSADSQWFENHRFVWDRKKLDKFLAKQKKDIYFLGMADNIWDIVDLFDKVFYLDLTENLLKKRLKNNERYNSFGKSPEQFQLILKAVNDMREKAKGAGWIILDSGKGREELLGEVIGGKRKLICLKR